MHLASRYFEILFYITPKTQRILLSSQNTTQFMAREAGIRQQIKSSFIPKDGKRKVRRKKPAWAHTEESKQEEDDVLAEEELDQLIKFTENLDFDKYLDTEEVPYLSLCAR